MSPNILSQDLEIYSICFFNGLCVGLSSTIITKIVFYCVVLLDLKQRFQHGRIEEVLTKACVNEYSLVAEAKAIFSISVKNAPNNIDANAYP